MYVWKVTTLQAVALMAFSNPTCGPLTFTALCEVFSHSIHAYILAYIHTFSKCTRKWIVQVLGIKDQEVLKRIMHSLSCGKFKVNWLYVLYMYVCSGEILIFLNARSWSACLPKAVVTRRRWGPKNMPHMNLCTVCMYVCMYSNDQIFKMQSFDITFKVSRIGRNSYDHSGAIFYV